MYLIGYDTKWKYLWNTRSHRRTLNLRNMNKGFGCLELEPCEEHWPAIPMCTPLGSFLQSLACKQLLFFKFPLESIIYKNQETTTYTDMVVLEFFFYLMIFKMYSFMWNSYLERPSTHFFIPHMATKARAVFIQVSFLTGRGASTSPIFLCCY